MKNLYQYQGDFSEMDEDIGWNDFDLRNYDAQIGRWVQMDPYGQYPSPYMGMGNDPMNGMDPDGGLFGLTSVELRLTTSFIGFMTGVVIAGTQEHPTAGSVWGAGLAGAGIGFLATRGISGFITILNGAGKVGQTMLQATMLSSINPSVNVSDVGNMDKVVKNSSNSFKRGSKIPVKEGNTRAGFILVSEFQKTGSPNNPPQGVEIELKYKNLRSTLKYYNWIQTIRTNVPKGGVTSPYNDPQPPDDESPFYWTEEENQTQNVAEGYDARFYDNPQRYGSNVNWEGELSLVGADASYIYREMITIRYGFTIDAKQNIHINNIKIQKASEFQKGLIQKARVHLFEAIKNWVNKLFTKLKG